MNHFNGHRVPATPHTFDCEHDEILKEAKAAQHEQFVLGFCIGFGAAVVALSIVATIFC